MKFANDVYDILGIVISLGIIAFYSFAIYYILKYRSFVSERKWETRDLYVYIDAAWIVVFLAVAISILAERPLIVAESFGALVIRPLILLNAVIHALASKRKYITLLLRHHHG